MNKNKINILENKFVYKIVCTLSSIIYNFLCGSVRYHEYNKDLFLDILPKGCLIFLWHKTLVIPVYANKFLNTYKLY